MSTDFFTKAQLQGFMTEVKNAECISIKLNDTTRKYLEPSSFIIRSLNKVPKIKAKVTFVNEENLWFRFDFPIRKSIGGEEELGFTTLAAYDAYKLKKANYLSIVSDKDEFI